MPIIIVIAGAARHVGKTTVLRQLASLLENSVSLKLGKSTESDKNKPEWFLPKETMIEDILQLPQVKLAQYLLIESTSILLTFTPDLAIFVEGSSQDRKSYADEVKAKCDVVVRAGDNLTALFASILAGTSAPLSDRAQ